jgi:hypothetical protein
MAIGLAMDMAIHVAIDMVTKMAVGMTIECPSIWLPK